MEVQLTKNYFIRQNSSSPFRWDLIRASKGKRKGEEVDTEIVEAYGVDLDFVLRHIPEFEISLMENERMQLDEFIDLYKTLQNELKQVIEKIIK